MWIYNSKEEILLQLRAKNKDICPSMWDISVAGHVGAGENEIDSLLREAKEEIGLDLKKEDLEFFKIRKNDNPNFKGLINNEFYYVYLAKYNGDIKNLKIQKEELDAIKFISLDELEKELKEHSEEFVNHGDYWREVMEKIKEKLVLF